jgi:lysophospholipase L1-like esterase
MIRLIRPIRPVCLTAATLAPRSALACLLAGGMAAGFAAEAGAPAPVLTFGNLRANRIVFLGNSITLHGPLASIGWSGNWGMAATAQEKDYVHLILAAIAKTAGGTPEARIDNIADIERQYATIDIEARLKDHLAFKPDILVLAIGENVPALATDADRSAFQAAVARLLNGFRQAGCPALFVRSCFWPEAAKDEALRQACAVAGGTYIDIGSLGRDPANAARAERAIEHAGVAGHPGDRGMQAIAEAILGAMEARQ